MISAQININGLLKKITVNKNVMKIYRVVKFFVKVKHVLRLNVMNLKLRFPIHLVYALQITLK